MKRDDAVSVRRAIQADLAAVAAIQAQSPEAAHWDPPDYLAHDFLVAVSGGQILGFAVARRLADGESELLNLAVRPDVRRLGIGRKLVAELTSEYPGDLWLEVRESNLAGRKFYNALGFSESGRRPEYYPESYECAIVMNIHS